MFEIENINQCFPLIVAHKLNYFIILLHVILFYFILFY